jgi:hypothetical protein
MGNVWSTSEDAWLLLLVGSEHIPLIHEFGPPVVPQGCRTTIKRHDTFIFRVASTERACLGPSLWSVLKIQSSCAFTLYSDPLRATLRWKFIKSGLPPHLSILQIIIVYCLSHRVLGCVFVVIEISGGLRILLYASEMMPNTSEHRN